MKKLSLLLVAALTFFVFSIPPSLNAQPNGENAYLHPNGWCINFAWNCFVVELPPVIIKTSC
jgi:hypothetical protein